MVLLLNATIIRPNIDDSVHLHVIVFPYVEFSLPDGFEDNSFILSDEQHNNLFKVSSSLRLPFDPVLRDLNPHCFITDMFLP
ncbi:hypothetical protein IEQ34_007295 [Dendrobium chrysotoxum]|uniref:Uncharacterized protein n=1 Tax=Dendrobium chrysotoxum TaxID=161865 RepID=A0AAV7H9W8_DENCH|nr:hypothetical protein IEQ34_007295 [Dendrobium chrysotoxum]